MSVNFSTNALKSFEMTATTAAAYLDACDTGAQHLRLDPDYYQQCGRVLQQIFSLVDDAALHFPDLVNRSAAARNALDNVAIGRHISVSCLGFYPELAIVLQKAAA